MYQVAEVKVTVHGPVVQWLEHSAHNGGVVGSSPARTTFYILNLFFCVRKN